jgi:hypothetical protein
MRLDSLIGGTVSATTALRWFTRRQSLMMERPMLDLLDMLWFIAGVVVFGGAMLAFALHSAGIVWWMTKGRKK